MKQSTLDLLRKIPSQGSVCYPRRGITLQTLTLLFFFLFSVQNLSAQNQTVSGTVVDSNNQSLPGVSVLVKNTSKGLVTDIDGKFSLSGLQGNETIIFSFVGMVTQEVAINGQTQLSVVMKDSSIGLDEVVAIGYGSIKKSDVTGSVVSVNSEELARKSIANLSEGLQGLAAGVQVSRNSGKPGESANVLIRGIGTINNSTKPLYVVDGIMVGTDADFLNPSDIESIEVLKDASATAIYGSRGANGVIMITTVKGEEGKTQILGKATFGVNTLSEKIEVEDMAGFTAAANQMNINDGTAPNPTWADPSKLHYIDWQDEMTESTLRQQYYVSASGGTKEMNASMSVGYLDDKGIIRANDYRKISTRANVDMNIQDFIKIGLSVGYTREDGEGSGNLYNYATLIPTMDYTDENGKIVHEPVVHPDGSWGTFKDADAASLYVNKDSDNPVAIAETREAPWFKNRALANAYIEIQLLKGLSFKSVNGINYEAGGGHWYSERHTRTTNATGIDEFNLNNWSSMEYLTENFITFNQVFGANRLNLMAGFSANQKEGQNVKFGARDYPAPNIRQVALTQDPDSKYGEGKLHLESRMSSVFGRMNYTLKDRYILTATVRRDGSSNFGPNNKYGTFPSASLAWRVSEEEFLTGGPFSNLKFRLGWGQTGNAGYGTNVYMQQLTSDRVMYYTYDYTNPTTHNPAGGLALNKIVNPDLKWETNEQTNIGIDVGLAENALTLSLDYFKRDAKDLLLYRKVRPSTGFNDFYTNTGHIRNSGYEWLATYQKQVGDLKMKLSFNGASIKNEAVDVGDPIYFGDPDDNYDDIVAGNEWSNYSITQNGEPVGSWYGYVTDGIFQSDEEAEKGPSLAGSKAGDRRYKDLNGDGSITPDDKQVIGNGHPDFTYGLTLNLEYKNFDFALMGHGVSGADILSYAYANMIVPVQQPGGGNRNIAPGILENSWSATNTSATNPRFTKTNVDLNSRISDAYIVDGDYFKIQSLQFGYTFPKSTLNKTKVNSARIYFNIDNVQTFSKYDFGDPEVGNSDARATGFDAGRYPFPRVYSFGISLGL